MRKGQEYVAGLKLNPREVWISGRRVQDVSTAPEFAPIVSTLAKLFDLQCQPDLRQKMSFVAPETGQDCGLSFVLPRNREDLIRRGEMIYQWSTSHHGLLGRSPDFVNVNIAAWAAAADFFGTCRADFSQNITRYYRFVRDNDLVLTHSVMNFRKSKDSQDSGGLELKIVKETLEGVYVSGSRTMATLAAVCDEVAIYPGRIGGAIEGSEDQAIAFAIPVGTPGLKLVCRESFAGPSASFDHPLSSRFEQSDSILFFDQVFIPWERVFLWRSTRHLNLLHTATGSMAHSAHQSTIKAIAKTEFFVGLALRATEVYGSVDLPHIQQMLAELIVVLEAMKSLRFSGEQNAQIDCWGIMRPDIVTMEVARVMFMQCYPRMVEILKLLGSSNLILLPSESDFESEIAGSLDQFLVTNSSTAFDRVGISRILWDITCSAFGQREEMYERFYAGGLAKSQQFLFQTVPPEQRDALKNGLTDLLQTPSDQVADRVNDISHLAKLKSF